MIHTSLRDYLRSLGHQVEIIRDGHTLLRRISAQRYDLALIDLRIPDINSTELLTRIQQHRPDTPVVLISGDEVMEALIEVFRLDSRTFVTQSTQSSSVDVERDRERQADNLPISRPGPQTERQSLVGNSRDTQRVRDQIRLAVEANVDTVLVAGETGTGKEVVAREIHSQTSEEERPFIAVNCSALPESLVESELFGHVEGAFTGATRDKAGYFELADNGTLFLDEIAELGVHTQAKLLRILETRTLIRVGGTQEISVQERVISSLNRDPLQIVESGQLRSDLFYRLNVFPIHLRPLRERPEDILPLAEHFLAAYTARSERSFDGFSDEAKAVLRDYPYPGNARELRNIVERSAILCPLEVSLIGAEHLDIPRDTLETVRPQSDQSTDESESHRILQALEATRWNRRQAAIRLGVPYSTLRYKMKKLGIS